MPTTLASRAPLFGLLVSFGFLVACPQTVPEPEARDGATFDGAAGRGAGGASGAGGSPSVPATDTDRRVLLARSRAAWTALKTREVADYTYLDRFRVEPFGGEISTTIEVRGDKVVRRTYDGGTSWTEIGATLGSHDATEKRAAPAITLDELYTRCETEILTSDEGRYTLVLRTHDDGVLATCTRWPRGCQDDCAEGYRVTSYQFLD